MLSCLGEEKKVSEKILIQKKTEASVKEHISSNEELVESITGHLSIYIDEKIHEIVDDRFGFLNIPRMIYHSLIVEDIDRKKIWYDVVNETFKKTDIEKIINSDIEKYNSNHPLSKINPVVIEKYVSSDLITDEVFDLIKEREEKEWVDILVDLFISIVIGYIFGFVAGFIFGYITGDSNPPGCLVFFVEIIVTILAFYFSYKYIILQCIEIEGNISNAVYNNMIEYISSQNILESILY